MPDPARRPTPTDRAAERFPVGDVLLTPSRATLAWLRAGRRGPRVNDGEPSEVPTSWSVGLGLGIGLDELVRSVMRIRRLRPSDAEIARIGRDILEARAVLDDRGWLDDPRSFHLDPPAPDGVELRRDEVRGIEFEHLTFESGFEPHAELPERDAWLAHVDNRTTHAMVARHADDEPRPWLVVLHGFSMGHPNDLKMFGTDTVRDHGVNVIHPVFPLHGPRKFGRTSGDGVINHDALANLHGLAQAVWDTRRCIAWARSQGATRIAVHGMSLGGYTTALLAGVTDDLDAAIAGIPPADLVNVLDRSTPWGQKSHDGMAMLLGDEARDVHRVVSPLALEPLIAHEARFIYAGVGDRMATPQQAELLWRHWERPELLWFDGSHVGAFYNCDARRFARKAIYSSLLGSDAATDGEDRR